MVKIPCGSFLKISQN